MSRPAKPKEDKRERSFKTYVKNSTFESLEKYCRSMNYPSISYANSVILEIFFSSKDLEPGKSKKMDK